jgi:hypothetical protein
LEVVDTLSVTVGSGDAAGWAMMPVALGLVSLGLWVLSWLLDDVEEVEAPVYRKARGS